MPEEPSNPEYLSSPEPLSIEVREARREVAKLVTQRNAFLRASARVGTIDHGALRNIDVGIADVLDRFAPMVDPCDAPADVPLVLFPVRLETKFSRVGRQRVVKVRIGPDEIHMDALARGLTPDELSAAQAYWTAAWSDPVPGEAWESLVDAVGSHRAEWVAHVTTPTNLAERAPSTAPDIPKVEARTPRNVVARSLPDRFVVIADQGGRISRIAGRPIPPDLAMSPVPLEGDQPVRVNGVLSVPPGSEWLIDFTEAERVGMAVTLPLVGGDAPIDRLVAIGTRATLSPAAAADELEDLLTGHRFGDGFALLAQGTPTNNADGERSPYRTRRVPVAPPLTPTEAAPDSDASALARQLGIDAAVVTALVGSGSGEQTVAQHVNTALWNPGFGRFLQRLDAQGVPGVVDAQRESARRLFRDHVRGRGVAPAVHVGAQPYGVMPVSDLGRWAPRSGETTAGIVSVVRMLLSQRWRPAADRQVPRLRSGVARLESVLLEVMGSSPVMQGLRVRSVLTADVADAMMAALGITHREYEDERISMAAPLASLLGSDSYKAAIGSLGVSTRPLPLPLASDRDPEFMAAVLQPQARVPAVDSVLQALIALAWASTELDVAKAAPASVLPELLNLVELSAELRTQMVTTVANADAAPAADIHRVVTRLADAGVAVGTASMLNSYEPVGAIQTSLAEVALSAPVSTQSKQLAASAVTGWLAAMGYRSEVRDAMRALSASTTEARALAVAESLDCSSHRLDAWATAVVAERRARQVATARSVRGLTIGAYGVVHELSPLSGPPPTGWIHAPTTRHASAAGMLRSSHLAHLPTSGRASDGGPFAIDLSSSRIRAASQVIDGIRSGQPMGALIGYRIERDLAAVNLARLQLSVRTLAPLVARRLHDVTGDEQAAQEAVAATNVVDGVLLLRRYPPGDGRLRDELDRRPDNEYLGPDDWPLLTEAQWNAVTRVLRDATDVVDAVADIMLSEAVLQFAGGNTTRAAAAMDATATGAAPADTVDVLESNDSGERLTHRVLAVVGDDAPASSWNTARPRARMAPALEVWAAQVLGDPSTIVVVDGDDAEGDHVTLDAAGLCALDVVFAADIATLERIVRTAVPDVGGAALAVRRNAAWPRSLRALGQIVPLARTMRELIAGARPLLPADLVRSGATLTRTVDLPELIGRLDELVGGLEAVVASCAAAISGLPEDDIVDSIDHAIDVTNRIVELTDYGLPPDPDVQRPLDLRWARLAWQTAESRALAARAGHEACVVALADGTPEHLVLDLVHDAVGVIFTGGFTVSPRLLPGADDALAGEIAAPAFAPPAASQVTRFVADLATVRPQMQRVADVAMLAGAPTGIARGFEVVQLAERLADGSPAAGTEQWLAGRVPVEGAWPDAPVVHLVIDRLGSVAGPIAGLVFDAWVEDLPEHVGTDVDPAEARPHRARTGLAVRSHSASARPPQAILCAVSPDGRRWTTDSIRGVVDQTIGLAQARLVTLERLAGEAVVLPALYVNSSSLQGEPSLDLKLLGAVSGQFVSMKYVKEVSTS